MSGGRFVPGDFARPPSSPGTPGGGAYGSNFGSMQMPPGGSGGFPPGAPGGGPYGISQGTPPGFPQGSLSGMPGSGLGPGNPVGFPQSNFGGMPQGAPSGGMMDSSLGQRCFHCGDRNAEILRSQLQQVNNHAQQMEQQVRMMQERAIRAEEQVQHTGLNQSKRMEDFDLRLKKSDEARVDAEQKLRIMKQEKQELVERVSVLEREKQMSSGSLVDSAALQEKRQYMKKIDELQDTASQHQQQQIHAMSEVQRLQEVVATMEARQRELLEQNDELREDLNIVEAEAVRLEALYKASQQVVDEKEVQVAALQLYEAEFDRTFSAKLDEREQAFKAATEENKALALKVRELQDELGHCQKTGVQGNVQELTDMLREMQEKIYDLEDDVSDFKEENTRLKYELEQAGGVHSPSVAIPPGGAGPVPVTAETQRDQQLEEMQQRLANFQRDKVEKDQKVDDLERKLDEFAANLGAQGLLAQNRQYERQVQDMKKQVAEAKHDLSQYLSDAAGLVHENDMLRQFLNKTPEEIQRDLPKYKLKEKVTSAKAVSEKRELEYEVAALEDERMKLKTRLKQMSGLAAEKVALLHDLQPEQMLHLEEIAASMRRGKYEPPLTDQSRQLKKEKEELQKKLSEKDAQFAAHIDDRISSLLEKTGASKDLETKLAAVQQENLGLRDTLKMLNDGIATQMGGMPFELQQLQAQLQNQVQAQLQNQAVPRIEQGVGPSMPPTPAAGAGVRLPPPSPSASSILNFSNIGGNTVQADLAQKMQRMQKAQKAQMALNQSMMGGSMGPLGMSMMGGGGMGAMPMPQMVGMPPMAWSPLMQAHVQQPRELVDGSQATTCALYCQVVETVEELEKERALRKSLSEDVEVFSQKYDRLLAQQEVLYKDYFRQRANWDAERKGLEDRLKLQNDMIADVRRKSEDHERQNLQLQDMVRARAPGEPDGDYKTKLIDAMTRIAALEQNESVLTRKCDSAQQDHATVRQAFDNLEKDLADRDKYLKERLAKALLWKKSASNALRFARKRLSQMVPAPSFERAQQELAVSKRRELDLARRQSDLALANARNEDRLREMSDLQERSSNLDIILRETEQEYTVLRRRLQRFDAPFAAECSLFARLAAEVQRALGLVGQWDPVQRALIAELGTQVADGEHVQLQSIDVLFDERLRRLDTNNDGFVTLGDVISNLENMGLKVSVTEVTVLAEAFHIISPVQPTVVQQPGQAPAPPSAASSVDVGTLKKASVSVLAVVGRLRLFGLRRLEPEDLFWAAVQASMMRRQLDSQRMCKTHFQVLRNPSGFITVLDILRVLGSIDVAAERLPTRGLRRVLAWLGVESRVLDQEAPLENLPRPGDPMDAEVRSKLARIQLIYHDFESRFEKNCARALQILCPSEAYPDATDQPAPAVAKVTDPVLQRQMAEAREAASNRRCVVLEQEVRTKVRTVKELQRQVSELEQLTQRLEAELHEERGRGVEIKSRLDTTLLSLSIKSPEDAVGLEQKLKKLDESTFQVQQLQFELQQEKDMRRTCANQAESYEKLVKRRQQEVRHLQETVKMIQCKDEVSNTVGKIQYRLLLSLWEKSNLQRQLEAATRELKQVRTQYTEYETEIEKEKSMWHQEHESLQQRLVDANQMSATYQEQATGSMPMEKARELTAKVDQIAASKSALEEKLVVARKQLHRNETERQELQLKADQAKFLYDELAKFEASKAPEMADQVQKSAFERLREIAEKLEASKLLELKHKRDLEISKEEYTQTLLLRKADEQEIERLQKEVAQAEKKMVEEGEQWREKLNTMQKSMLSSGAYTVTAADGTQSSPIMRFRGGTQSQVEELTNRLNDKDVKIGELEANLEKLEAEKKEKIADEQMRYRKLERELELVMNSDPARLRQVLRAEHEEEIKQVSAAAHESVATLQELLNQADAGINERDQKIQELLQAKRTASEGHKREMLDLQNQIKELRIKNISSPEHWPQTPASVHGGTVNLHESLLEASMHSLDGFGVEPLLEERREELYKLQQERSAQEGRMRQLQQDAVSREQGLREDFHAREKQFYEAARAREQEFRKREQEMRQRCEYLEEQIRLVHSQGLHGIAAAHEEVRKSSHHAHAQHQNLQQNIQMHVLSLEEQKMATDLAQAEVRQLRVELEAEREKNKHASMRKQQTALRDQMNKKQEQLDRQRQEVQELKNQFVQLSLDRDREKVECQQARAAETEMRGRVSQLEERLRGVNEHVTRVTQQLQDQKQQASHEIARMADNRTRERELELLLDEASARLAERSSEARKATEASHQHQAMRDSAEQMLKSEREVMMGDVRSAKEEARITAEANTKRIATLHERIDQILAERDQLLDKLQSYGGSSPRIVSDLQEKLKREQVLRDELQGQVSDLQSKLELSQLRKGFNATSPQARDAMRLDMSAPLPSSPKLGGGLDLPAARSRSASPITQIQPNHLIAQAAELTAKCNQLEIESAAARAKVTKLEQENDDMKLKLMTQQGSEDYDRVRFSNDSYGFQRNFAADLDEERVRSRMLEEQGRQYNVKIQQLQQRLRDVTQQLDVERDRVRTSSQALEAERRNAMGQSAPLNRLSNPDATAVVQLQSENDSLRNQLRQALEDNVRLNREASMSAAASNARTSAIANPQVVQLQSQLADARSRLEEMLQVNSNLRRSLTPERAATMQADVAAMNVRFQGMQSQLEQLMTENVELRRSASPDPFGSADLTRQVANLKAKNAELLREVVQLQRDPSGMSLRPDGSGLQQRLNDAQSQIQMLMQENAQLRQDASLRSGVGMGGADAADLIAARRQVMDLQTRMDQLVQENVQLQRMQPRAARIDGPPGGLGLGQYADEHEMGQLRKLHDENRAQRKALELLLARAALDTETGASFAPLVEEIQQLERRVQDLSDENVSLRLRLPQVVGLVGGGVLPKIPPVAPGTLQEVQEANAILRAKFEAMCNDQAGSVRRLQEVTRRVDELLAENMQLRRQCQRPTLLTNNTDREKEHERARDLAEVERDRAEKNHRAAAERLRLQTARVAELTADRDELQQKLREATVREFALTRQGRPGSGGELRTADDDADRQYLLAKVDSLQNENDGLRQWAERQQLNMASDQGDVTLQFKKDHQSLMERNARLTLQNQNLQREVADLQRERALLPEAVEVAPRRIATYEDDLKLLKLRNEELEREMATMRQIPETSMAIFDTAKTRIEQAGVTLLQVLKALDLTRQGRLPLQVVDFALRKLPLSMPTGDKSTSLLSSARMFQDYEDTVRYVDWLDHLLTLPPGEAFVAPLVQGSKLPSRQAGILDEAQQLRGFSLRSALLAIDQDGDGLIPYDQLNHAFSTFFEFLKQEEVDMLTSSFVETSMGAHDKSTGKRPVSLMDVVWKLDTAFLVSAGQIDAVQALQETDAEDGRVAQRMSVGDHTPNRSPEVERARAAADSLRQALKRRGLSLVAILADLDPLQHGQVLFDAFRVAASRYRLGLSNVDLGRLKSALHLNSQGHFATTELLRLIRSLESPAAQEDVGNGRTRGGEALEGLPPPQTNTAARRRIRSTGGYPRASAPEAEMGPSEARHRRQVEALNASLHQAEEDRKRLQRELNDIKQRDVEAGQKAAKESAQKQALAATTAPQPLKVLLAAGESAATVKELRLEVQGTRDLRDKLFAVETQLEECNRRLHVDVRAELEREQQKVRTLQNELEDRERTIAHLGFDLKRARAAASNGDVAEEYHMTVDLQLRRVEEELTTRKKNENALADKLLEQSHQTMEMRFEREQARARASRLENRLLELELLATAQPGAGVSTHPTLPAPASKQVKSLEQVIEGLERVIAQQKAENKRLKDDADGKHDDRRQKAEVSRLRKKVESLEEQLGAQDQQNRRGRATTAQRIDELNHARKAQETAEVELRRKEAQITALEQQLRDLSIARAGGRIESAVSDDSGDAARLGLELQELRMAREADAAALDEAQRALHEAELTEKRYVEVARENKRLRAEMGALEDEGFWREIEALQTRADEGDKLLQESREAMCSLFGAFPSLEPPSALLVRIDRHVATVAPAA